MAIIAPSQDESQPRETERLTYAWKVLLLSELGSKSLIVVFFILISGALAYFASGYSLVWCAITLCLLFSYFGNIFFTHHYSMDEDGIKVRTIYRESERKWSEFRRVVEIQHGVDLLTRAHESRFDFFRSLKVFLPADRKGELLSFIKGNVVQNVETELSTDED